MTFEDLWTKYTWQPIRNCPGRYICTDCPPDLSTQALLGANSRLYEFSVEKARDRVVIARLDSGGVISYKRTDGTYLHTLNDPDGFARKLDQLGIVLPETDTDAGSPQVK